MVRSGPRSLRPLHAPVEPSDLVPRLLAGDEALFASLVAQWQSGLLRLAQALTGSGATAEEVVQETWVSVLRSLHTFEMRSSLRTWVYRVCAHVAFGRARRDGRSRAPEVPAEDPDRFDARGAWRHSPARWPDETPEALLARRQAVECIQQALVTLPVRQRAVITLRDVQGFSSEEACEILGVTEVHQRLLLHRARTRVRAACEEFYREVA
ncbi:MAG TPA: sigma-70 family RNA polymerase sigma factor [Myxococcaceae bacterium]|nr:sigma-70 family RNA polymerase sigma factor [Myxococcaceae bacterium]